MAFHQRRLRQRLGMAIHRVSRRFSWYTEFLQHVLNSAAELMPLKQENVVNRNVAGAAANGDMQSERLLLVRPSISAVACLLDSITEFLSRQVSTIKQRFASRLAVALAGCAQRSSLSKSPLSRFLNLALPLLISNRFVYSPQRARTAFGHCNAYADCYRFSVLLMHPLPYRNTSHRRFLAKLSPLLGPSNTVT